MSITKSRLKKGKLTLTPDGGIAVDFSCQPTNVTLSTDYEEDGEVLEVLCGDSDAPTLKTGRTLKVTAVQDFDDPNGFINFLWDNETEVVAFTWTPNSDGGPTYTGRVQCRLGDIGGDVAAQLTSDLELPVIGEVDRAFPAAPTFTAEEDTTDSTRMTVKVTVTANGPAAIAFGDARDKGDDTTDTPDAGTATHLYTEPNTFTIKVTGQSGASATRSVTLPYADGGGG